MVARNVGLFGTFIANMADNPSYSIGGASMGMVPGSANLFGLGGGVVYYFESVNMYVSGAVAGIQVDLSDSNDNTVYETNFGMGLQGMFGKEWWISPNWGVGLAAEVLGSTAMADKNDSSVKWSGTGFSFVFSSTYN